MNFPSIEIQGAVLSADLLGKIRSEQATFQQGKDFQLGLTNARLKDEISLAWQEAKGQWVIYKSKLARLKEGETATTETRNFWMIPLFTNLGYNLTYSKAAEELNGKLFPIGYRDSGLDNFPVFVGGYYESLDKRPENRQLRISPHALVQEYLNYSEHVYGLVTNGRLLRLLRDASRITRLSYVEFNLEKMMEEDLYADFVILYRVLHASRMPKKMDGAGDSIIEKYHEEGLAAGSAIRSKLGDAVKKAILDLANEFINHPDNIALRRVLSDGKLDFDEYYHHQLRIIYRLLFLFVIEERNLIYAESKMPEIRRFAGIYFRYYSLLRLRKLAGKLAFPEAHRHSDLWQSLIETFSLFERKEIGEKLGIMALQGDLFGYEAISNQLYDLHHCYISNAVLLNIIASLGYFDNESGVHIAVNYGGLDVEEFGSVYEGLLELKFKIEKAPGDGMYKVDFESSNERGKSGSHYTPEELVQPLIKHSLEYLIEDRVKVYEQKRVTKEVAVQSLLQLKICDVACGSGHILLSAARRISLELARIQTGEEQPNPAAIRKALKAVVRNCIYGVDKNPLAVELCKIALWLEAYNPGEPLNFLDHHIKCGDAIVGLAHREELEKGIPDEAFKALPGDDKDIAKSWRDKNSKDRRERAANSTQLKADFEKATEESVQEAMAAYKVFNQMPETTAEETNRKAEAYKRFIEGRGASFLKTIADTQVAQFFVPKTIANENVLMSDGDFRLILSGYKGWQDRRIAKANAVAMEHRFFHWFIEFPEVFSEGGFDCVLGNPPFLGGQKLSGSFGYDYLEYLKNYYPPLGAEDLVAYFFRRIYSIIKTGGFQSLISTNTICQGKAREGGLEIILLQGAVINYAVKSTKWPGLANVDISLTSIAKSRQFVDVMLNGKITQGITSFLDDSLESKPPFPLKWNEGFGFQGSIILGKGFILNQHEAEELLEKDSKNKEIIFRYLIGDDLNNNVNQEPSRYVINFFNWDESKIKEYVDCYKIIYDKVRPQRLEIIAEKKSNGKQLGIHDKRSVDEWWKYLWPRPELYNKIKPLKRVLVQTRVSKTHAFAFVPTDYIFADVVLVFAFESFSQFSILQSSFHEAWAWQYSSTMKGDRRYSVSAAFQTFPFPKLDHDQEKRLNSLGETYYEHRKRLTNTLKIGLTKTFNLFNDESVKLSQDFVNSDLKKSVDVIANTLSSNVFVQDIVKLRELHILMDNMLLDMYNWNDILLRHDFYKIDYLPENDRIRYTIHPDARKEILKRLLQLNHQIHEEEVKAGLWEKKKSSGKKEKPEKSNELFD